MNYGFEGKQGYSSPLPSPERRCSRPRYPQGGGGLRILGMTRSHRHQAVVAQLLRNIAGSTARVINACSPSVTIAPRRWRRAESRLHKQSSRIKIGEEPAEGSSPTCKTRTPTRARQRPALAVRNKMLHRHATEQRGNILTVRTHQGHATLNLYRVDAPQNHASKPLP